MPSISFTERPPQSRHLESEGSSTQGESEGQGEIEEDLLEPATAPLDISTDRDGVPIQPRLKHYPLRIFGSQQRGFKAFWFTLYPTLEYSKREDSIYCFVCRHFSRTESRFITGYSRWDNALKDLKKHHDNSDHAFLVQKYSGYQASKLSGPITHQIDSQSKEDCSRHRRILMTFVRVLLVCAKQEIGSRGHRENSASLNKGNFLEIIDLLKMENPALAAEVAKLPKNALYTHHSTQNELIEICEELSLQKIKREVQNSSCFAVMADETRDKGGSEQLSVCVRFVRGAQIIERFIGYLHLEKFDAETISSGIVELLERVGIAIENYIAQSHDGARVMSGKDSGVQVRFQALVGGNCPYIHCYNHRLNLALIDSCQSIREIYLLLGLLQSIHFFQSNSARRSLFFVIAQRKLGQDVLRMPQSCETRWYSKRKGVQFFKNRFEAVLLAFQDVIENGKTRRFCAKVSQVNSGTSTRL